MTKESVNEQRPSTLYFNWISRLEYLKIFKLFCFSLKHKGFLSSPNKKVVLSHSFSQFFKDFFASLRSSFFESGKILPHPWEFVHHFLPRGRELDKKTCPGGRDSLAQKNFPRGCPGGMYPVGIHWDIILLFILGVYLPSASHNREEYCKYFDYLWALYDSLSSNGKVILMGDFGGDLGNSLGSKGRRDSNQRGLKQLDLTNYFNVFC